MTEVRQVPESAVRVAGLLTEGAGHSGIGKVLKTIRRHLNMDVAFICRFREQDRVMEYVDSDVTSWPRTGQVLPLDAGFCSRVVGGLLPGVIADASAHPLTRDDVRLLPFSIGAHLCVPLKLDDGEIYGTLCCFSYASDPSLGERDLQMMLAFAELLADRIGEMIGADRLRASRAKVIQDMIAGGDPQIVLQPIYEVRSGALVGVESLSRFAGGAPHRPPNEWFALAHQAGMGQELELLAIRKSLQVLDRLPEATFLCVNSSPDAILAGRLDEVLQDTDVSRVVLEITEHAIVADYRPLADALSSLRKRGLQLAIDDAGAGYANMRHILNLLPDAIKLDMSLTRDIDTDPHRRALARALIHFAQDIGSRITAEGVETEGELEMLRQLGVDKAQGYFLGKPMPVEDLLRLLA